MRIDSGIIGMDSERTYSTTEYTSRKYTASIAEGALGSDYFNNLLNTDAGEETEGEDKEGNFGLELSDPMEELRSKITNLRSQSLSEQNSIEETIDKLREEMINLLLRLLFPDLIDDGSRCSSGYSCKEQSGYISNAFEAQSLRVIHLNLQSQYYYEENETTSMSAQGIVKCADGREIDFGIELNMSRSFCEYYSEEVDFLEASLTDPLVINFDGNVTEVSDQTFYFDIDQDGVEDEISKLISGSGFLALDLNEDGIINDGSELFGTKSGNGFKDLEIYDTDHDGFIDEDDEVFDKLKIWAFDDNGEPKLYSLKDKGVGAIGLKNVSTKFNLNSMEDNSTNAVIRSTGVFLFEDGNVGTVQQVDFAKKTEDASGICIENRLCEANLL